MIAVKVLEKGPVKFIGNGRLPTHVFLLKAISVL